MRATSSRWLPVAFATLVWPIAAPGGVLAQDAPIPFRAACDLMPAENASTILGVPVTTDPSEPDAVCSYLHGDQQVAQIVLSPDTPFLMARLGLTGATAVTLGGLPAMSSPGDAETGSAQVVVGLSDGGILEIEVDDDPGVSDPEATARTLADAVLATGPVTAHADSATNVEAIAPTGSPCDLVTLGELKQITGQPFSITRSSRAKSTCLFSAARGGVMVYLLIEPADLNMVRSKRTRSLTVADHPAIYSPADHLMAVDLGGGKLLGVEVSFLGKGAKLKNLTRTMQAIAETAMGRMAPVDAGQAVTCPMIGTDALVAASGIDLQPISGAGPDTCWFLTSDQRTALVLDITMHPDLATAWADAHDMFPDLPDPTDLVVAGHPASGATGASGTVIGVDLDGLTGQDGKVLAVVLLGTVPATMADPLAALESVASQVVSGM